MLDWWRDALSRRAGWLNALMIFSGLMAFVYVPWDLLVKPVAQDQEVWFGIMFEGYAAKVLAIPHWVVYGLSAYGLWRMRSWCWPWLSLYWAQVAFGMLVWNILYGGGLLGWTIGLVSGALFGALALALWRAKPLFEEAPKSLRERYGEWAVVTGASAGIGTEFARAFARQGVSCVLVARREDRLRLLADELEKSHAVQARCVVADLSEPDGAERLAGELEGLEVGIAVSNAGFGYAGRLDKQDPDRLRRMINLNCVAPVLLTRYLLPPMIERGRGAVIVTGSVAGRQPLPLHGVYSATKGFDLLFGESLWGELRGTGVDVLVLEPGSTESEFHDVAGELPHWGEPASRVVEVALEALGRQPSVVSGWYNWLRANAIRVLPRPIAALVAKNVIEEQTPVDMR